MNNNALKYDFRGYKILKGVINRLEDKPITSFSIGCQKPRYDDKNQIYEIITEISIKFGEEDCVFLFSSGFKINDLEWLEVMAEQTIVNELFRIAYPFFVSKIHDITADFRPGFIIPIVDLAKIDFTKKVVFNLNRVVKDNPNNNKPDEVVN